MNNTDDLVTAVPVGGIYSVASKHLVLRVDEQEKKYEGLRDFNEGHNMTESECLQNYFVGPSREGHMTGSRGSEAH